MGRKAKIGKQRKDRYYHLAKETGYRSRSAFKLIQLNRKFSFLQESRVLIDLCAAPGGWLQVASRNMPISSMIIGVDLFPIKPIPNVVSFTCDITTTKCRMQLRKEMKTWKADCVLHDGAPNVGTSWVLDAFSQAQLTLHALKLASEFLNKGGWFVTKVFRSKDYQPLLWVFHQMFKKVHVTKPQASRNESAEIFVVCQSYIAPDKIDSKFFDPKYIFKEIVGEETKQKATILRDPSKVKKPKAEGYAEGDYTLYHPVPVSKYMSSEDALEILNNCSELVFDDDSIASHPLTSKEIKLCCRDIKVLGRREVRDLLNWHKKYNKLKAESEEQEANQGKEKSKPEESESEEDEDDQVAKQLADIKEVERLAEKRKKKDALKKRKKLRERLHKSKELQTTLGDASQSQGESLFGLVNIKNTQQLQTVHTDDAGTVANDNEGPPEKQKKQLPSLKPVKTPQVIDEEEEDDDDDDDNDGSLIDSELEEDEANALRAEIERVSGRYDSESDPDSDEVASEDDDEPSGNPLMVDLEKEDPEVRAKRKTNLWFKKGVFSGLDEDEDEDFEIQQASSTYKQQGGVILEKTKSKEPDESKSKSKRSVSFNTTVTSLDDIGEEEEDELSSESDEEESQTRTKQNKLKKGPDSRSGGVGPNSRSKSDAYDSDSSDSDYDDEIMMRKNFDAEEMNENMNGTNEGKNKKRKLEGGEKEAEAVPAKKSVKIQHHLDPEGLALGTMMATSRKATREIIEHGYHRYSYGDQDRIPDWLRLDETRHCRRNMPVSKELVAEYRARLREVNARPIKKIAEAKARKKKRQMVKLEKLRKKAEVISDMVDSSETEKMHQMKNLYKKMKIGNKKKDVKYVVTRKHQASKRVSRPKGVKGPFKVVDPRMKKDVRGMKRAQERKKNNKKKR
ncbi:pre-rRNA 2'-O-ribose RNA methyltransferase FTSJ3-like [Lytechinus variegatus]|uniref:pre-rRNA 2'-O-ribose RNA methyltransferase FTSJ3-like n=1 Tax=Lytechinus variegatus TaxID=7654 RepID=UPI001BB163C5|nr:pre-rRNA 2'-O-ribose RNA methyltransferase FTSJ3-like [Lytechinus variegatus]